MYIHTYIYICVYECIYIDSVKMKATRRRKRKKKTKKTKQFEGFFAFGFVGRLDVFIVLFGCVKVKLWFRFTQAPGKSKMKKVVK